MGRRLAGEARMRVPVTIKGYIDLPDDEQERIEAYGDADPEACVRFDMDEHPEFFFMDLFMFNDDDVIVGQSE